MLWMMLMFVSWSFGTDQRVSDMRLLHPHLDNVYHSQAVDFVGAKWLILSKSVATPTNSPPSTQLKYITCVDTGGSQILCVALAPS